MAGAGRVEWDTSDMKRLIVGMDTIPIRLTRGVRDIVDDSSKELRDEWRDNARVTARQHGKLYPRAITYEVVDFGYLGLIGPESHRDQGGMGPGFEGGSVNQNPHHDGARAADTVFPRFERRASIAAADVFRGL